MKKSFALLFLLLPALCFSQDEDLRNYDWVYLDNIRSVKFHSTGLLLSLPLVSLGDPTPLSFSFDDLDGDVKDYVFTVVHCDSDWEPSELGEFEYLDGFSEGDIRDYEYSFKAKSIYTHYNLSFPNEDMQLTKSGNYLLKVYENEDEKRLAVTRRFLVADMQVKIHPKPVRPAMVSLGNTHQEIDFRITNENFEIKNPRQELFCTILQNGRWDNALNDISPLFTRPEEQIFDYQNKVVFPAGKEFRYIDLRSVRYRSPGVDSIIVTDGVYEAFLEKDGKRGAAPYYEYPDIDGNFIIENSDEGGRRSFNQVRTGDVFNQNTQEEREYNEALQNATPTQAAELTREYQRNLQRRTQEQQNRQTQIFGEDDFVSDIHDLQSEYINVLFSFSSVGEMQNQDLYIFGALSDWQCKPEFKMTYNPRINAYVAKVKLKQGYYNYAYAALPRGKSKPDFEETEGDWYEAENSYTILAYYRPFGSRFDQLIGVHTFSSRL